jgi:hypothetical protein
MNKLLFSPALSEGASGKQQIGAISKVISV